MGTLFHVIVNGLTYEGSGLHCLINYSLIGMLGLPWLVKAQRLPTGSAPHLLICLLIALAVQVSLWFVAEAVGVSVVWSAMAGYSLRERRSLGGSMEPFRQSLFTTALLCALGAILYYALTFPFITTLAHGLAIVMGLAIGQLLRIFMKNPR